jgi:hypothetical protein
MILDGVIDAHGRALSIRTINVSLTLLNTQRTAGFYMKNNMYMSSGNRMLRIYVLSEEKRLRVLQKHFD